MSKLDQVLILEPQNELRFRGPFSEKVTSYLTLTNPTDRRVCFKVKTTAPKRYCVCPNSGIVEPKSTMDVAVMLQPFDYDPNEKNKHKFMVQTMFAPEGEIIQETLWKDVNPENLMDTKLKCVFELPAEVSAPQNNVDVNSSLSEIKPAFNLKSEPHSPLPKSSSKISGSADLDLKKLLDENKRMRDEMASLRQANVQLNEEGLRLRRSNVGIDASSVGGGLQSSQGASLASLHGQTLQVNSITFWAIVLAVMLFGVLLGKFIV